MKKTYTSLFALALAVTTLVGYNVISAAWTAPTDAPPNANVEAPINVGVVTQYKEGNLAASILAATTEMRSNRYCDALGENCVSSPAGGTGDSLNPRVTFTLGDDQNRSVDIPTSAMCTVTGVSTGGCDTGFRCGIAEDQDGTWHVSQDNRGDCDGTPTCTYTCFGPGTEGASYSWQVSAFSCNASYSGNKCRPESITIYGENTRTVKCMSNFGAQVDDSYCPAPKPLTTAGGCSKTLAPSGGDSCDTGKD